MSKVKRVIHRTTRAEFQAKLVGEDRAKLKSQGRRVKAELTTERARIEEACRMLKAEREPQGINLADVVQRTRISRGAISRLENMVDPNPTIATLMRLAAALGKQLVISFEPTSKRR
jgi:DNA-binding phage protein